MTAAARPAGEKQRLINWLPENIRDGRMGNFLENVIDWGISRERYWGTPLPVWTCECGHIHVVGSAAELREMGDDVPEDIELHKPFIDAVTFTCPECGKQHAPRAGGHRLLVRQRLHAVCAVALSV